MIKAIIFDFGNTLIKTEDEKTFNEWKKLLKGTQIDIEEFSHLFTALYKTASAGYLSEKEMLGLLSLKFNYNFENFIKVMLNSHSLDDYTKQILLGLKKKYKVGLIANAMKEWVYYDLKRFDIKKIFDSIIISSETGVRKPDTRIFLKTLKELKVKPEECVFVTDELNEDLSGGKAIGMKTVWLKVRKEEESFKPDFVIKSLRELEKVIRVMENKLRN